MRNLAEDRSVIIKPADKGSAKKPIWLMAIDNPVTTQHLLMLRSLIKNLCVTLLEKVT